MLRVLLALLLLPALASAASFDCGKASSAAEKMICADAQLSELDEILDRHYHGALSSLAENAACLKADQRDWLRGKRSRCADAACLREAYRLRLSELYPLQPGINTQRKLDLPPAMAMMWVMGGVSDQYLAPKVASKAGSVQGELRLTDGAGGYVIREAGGTETLLLMDMDRGGANEASLASLAATQNGSPPTLVKGWIAPARPGGQAFFDLRRCIYLYRQSR